jgi:head-tail adaptor
MDVIGAKNRRIAFYKPTTVVDAANEPTAPQWIYVKHKWAQIKGETGMGAVRSASLAGNAVLTPLARYSFRVNYDTSLDASMQIRENDGSRLRIIGIRHDKEGRMWTDVIAEEGGNG